jgi:hypothetical protein
MITSGHPGHSPPIGIFVMLLMTLILKIKKKWVSWVSTAWWEHRELAQRSLGSHAK